MRKIVLFIAVCVIAQSNAFAVILFRTGDPNENTSAPSNDFAGSGWNYEGQFGGFLGTPIAPHFFISAAHIGQAGPNLVFQGSTYTLVRFFGLLNSDLMIWQVNETFPAYAPLYTKQDEIGKHLVVIGRGTQRGSAIVVGSTLKGWNWGTSDTVQRWGENDVTDIVPNNGHDLVYATFDSGNHPNEAHLSVGDSGGAVFLQDNGVWKLAGINYSVDDLYTTPSDASAFVAAIFDARGYYKKDDQGQFVLISGGSPVGSGFYASRIASERAWIYSVIDPNGDLEGDSISNLIEYALHLDPLQPDAAGLPQVERETNFVMLTYTKVTTATDINYAVEQSADLISWKIATTQDEIVSTNGNIQTIKAKVDSGAATKMFLRLIATRP